MLNYYNEFLKYMATNKTRKTDTEKLKKMKKYEMPLDVQGKKMV